MFLLPAKAVPKQDLVSWFHPNTVVCLILNYGHMLSLYRQMVLCIVIHAMPMVRKLIIGQDSKVLFREKKSLSFTFPAIFFIRWRW